METNIQLQRQLASVSSAGISSQPVYTKFLQLVETLNLQGDCLDFGAGIGNLAQLIQNLGRFNSITAADIMQRPTSLD
ncbi:hypothetical protein PN473_18675, partial [Dolichospermum circinale CS-545/17]|nr:hypothetical protein [Dolichospermum circinale CS-545/17]